MDLGSTRTKPLPEQKALEMIFEKLQRCVFHIFISNTVIARTCSIYFAFLLLLDPVPRDLIRWQKLKGFKRGPVNLGIAVKAWHPSVTGMAPAV